MSPDFLTIALFLLGSGVLVAFAPVPPVPPEPTPEVAEHEAMRARLRDGLADPHRLTIAEIEYWGERYAGLCIRHWAQMSFGAYLLDPEAAEAVTRVRRMKGAVAHAEMVAAMGPTPVAGVTPGTFPATALVLN